MQCNYKLVRPSARGIELILFGGINPTSVTTTVIHVGGVKSYKGLSISRFDVGRTFFEFPVDPNKRAGAVKAQIRGGRSCKYM